MDWDDPITIPNGLAIVCQNMAFLAESVKTRWGLRVAAQLAGLNANMTGFDVLTILGTPLVPTAGNTLQQAGGGVRWVHNNLRWRVGTGQQSLVIGANVQAGLGFTDTGELLLELPAGSGNLVALPNTRIAAALEALLPVNAYMLTTKAYNRIYQAFTDLQASKGPVLTLDAATGCEIPVGQNPIAAVWTPNTFYAVGDIVTPTTTPNIWYRRTVTGYSGASEPAWPALQPGLANCFTAGYVAVLGFATDNNVAQAWQEWTAGFPYVLPTPSPIYTVTPSAGGTLPSGDDIYICLSYYNDLGESVWTTPFVFYNISASQQITCEFNTVVPALSGPGMPQWLMSIMTKGNTHEFHWPAHNCLNVYVAAVTHGSGAPTNYKRYAQTTADQPVVIQSIPGSGTNYTAPQTATAVITLRQFKGEGGTRNAILLRQDMMGNLSPVDPQAVMPVAFPGANSASDVEITVSAAGTTLYIVLDDVTQYAPGSTIVIQGAQQMQGGATVGTPLAWNGSYTVSSIALGSAIYGNPAFSTPTPFPGGTLVCNLAGSLTPATFFTATSDLYSQGTAGAGHDAVNLSLFADFIQGELTSGMQLVVFGDPTTYSITNTIAASGGPAPTPYTVAPVDISPSLQQNFAATNPGVTILVPNAIPTCTVNTEPGSCPVAIVPPGTTDGPGYTYDVVAFAVVGIGVDGPFTYLASTDPATPFTANIIEEIGDGNGNCYALLSAIAGLAAGDVVDIEGWSGGNTGLNGQRTIASLAQNGGANAVTFPEPSSLSGTETQTTPPTMTVVQSLPTLVIGASGPFALQFDDTTLPQGVDVTGNLLFSAVPPCVDLAYIPSVDRMAYISDLYPTMIVWSEEEFMGEVDGLNDVQQVEPSNGAKVVGVRELLNGMIIAAKQTGGYQVTPTTDVPARWGAGRLWGVHGPSSGKNIARGRDGTTGLDFFMFVDPESGLYKWPPTLGQGELDWLSKELSGANNQDSARQATWDRVNRAYGHLIEVVIDDIAKEVKIAVPLDGATTPSHILTMSFFNGWQDPLMLTLSGEWVANRQSRRWNIDPIPTKCMAMVTRTLATPVDQRVNYHQLLLGTLALEGGCGMAYMQPGEYDDFGAAISSRYRPAYTHEQPNQMWPAGGRVMRFSAVTGHVIGNGVMTITPITTSPEYDAPPATVDLTQGEAEVPGSAPVTHFAEGIKGDGEFLTNEFATDGEPGSWFQLCEYVNWARPLVHTR